MTKNELTVLTELIIYHVSSVDSFGSVSYLCWGFYLL